MPDHDQLHYRDIFEFSQAGNTNETLIIVNNSNNITTYPKWFSIQIMSWRIRYSQKIKTVSLDFNECNFWSFQLYL